MIVVIDNFDSFTFNLVQAFGVLGVELRVFRNDAVDAAGLDELAPEAIVLSPGPGRPEEAGCCLEVIGALGARVPLLGVCLGHQAIAIAYGATVERAPEVVHGKVAAVRHDGRGLYRGIESPLEAARYHSLVVPAEQLPDELVVDATAAGGLVMGMHHRDHPVWGVQFHPESIATRDGPRLLANFLELARERRAEEASC